MADHDIFRDGKVHVLSDKCATCIFTTNRPVDGARVASMVTATKDDPGATIPCHATLYRPGKREHAICRGWYDRFADQDVVLGLAMANNIIEFDPPPTDSVWPKPKAEQ